MDGVEDMYGFICHNCGKKLDEKILKGTLPTTINCDFCGEAIGVHRYYNPKWEVPE